MYIPRQDRDVARTIGINTGHVGSSDYKLEQEDREFVVQVSSRWYDMCTEWWPWLTHITNSKLKRFTSSSAICDTLKMFNFCWMSWHVLLVTWHFDTTHLLSTPLTSMDMYIQNVKYHVKKSQARRKNIHTHVHTLENFHGFKFSVTLSYHLREVTTPQRLSSGTSPMSSLNTWWRDVVELLHLVVSQRLS